MIGMEVGESKERLFCKKNLALLFDSITSPPWILVSFLAKFKGKQLKLGNVQVVLEFLYLQNCTKAEGIILTLDS